jgi:hypothetical protein
VARWNDGGLMSDYVKVTAKHKDGKQYLEGYTHSADLINHAPLVFWSDANADVVSVFIYAQNREDWTIEKVEPTSTEIVHRLKPGSVFEEWGKSSHSYNNTWFVQNNDKIIDLDGNMIRRHATDTWDNYIIVIKEEVL